MQMNRGMQMMVESLIKMLGLDPVKISTAVEDIRKSVYSASIEMQTIRRQNDLIMAKMGLSLETTEQSHDRPDQPAALAGTAGSTQARNPADAGAGN